LIIFERRGGTNEGDLPKNLPIDIEKLAKDLRARQKTVGRISAA
jgi:hypothetical protein